MEHSPLATTTADARALQRMRPVRVLTVGLVIVTSGLGVSGCHQYRAYRPARAAGDAPATGAIIVTNQTPDSLSVSPAGDGARTVAPGATVKLGQLSPGPIALTAHSQLADVTYRETLEVTAGETGAWLVSPDAASLSVQNPLDGAVEVLVDGAPAFTVGAGATQRADGLAAGTRLLVARAVDGGYEVRLSQPLVPDQPFAWVLPARQGGPLEKIPPGKGLIRLKNHASMAVRVVVGDGQVVEVRPGERVRIIVDAGSHQLEAQQVGSQIASRHSVDVAADQVAEWDYGLDDAP